MATGTGDITALVVATFPGSNMLIVLVAGEAHAVLLLDGYIRRETKIHYRWPLLSRPHFPDMSALIQVLLRCGRASHTRPVTGLALQLGERRPLIALLPVFGLEDIEHGVFRVFVMALDAGISAFVREGASPQILHGSRGSGC